jgi:hypothetical protein
MALGLVALWAAPVLLLASGKFRLSGSKGGDETKRRQREPSPANLRVAHEVEQSAKPTSMPSS